jgi:Glycoside hydrolase 123, catalytic domain
MEGQYLPAGDSHILYPLPEGPLSSHRFEAHRIGLEDYELLAQLKSHDASRAEQIIARVVQGFDKYSKDVTVYRAAKEELLNAVDEYTNE